jgi:plasmid stabilization system protein ParE
MKRRVRLSARAERDIDETLAWLCRQGADSAASRWHERLLAAVATLEREPERCPIAPESEELGIELRELLFGRRQGIYRILFIIEQRTVTVVHIRHAARDALRPDDLL